LCADFLNTEPFAADVIACSKKKQFQENLHVYPVHRH